MAHPKLKLTCKDHQSPKLVASLVGKKVVGATSQEVKAVWTEEGELFTFGVSPWLGHGGKCSGLLPRRVEALAGEKVVGAAGSCTHTVVRTASGKAYVFGQGMFGQLGRGSLENEPLPKCVEMWAEHPWCIGKRL